MRTTAQIDEVALPIQADRLVGGNAGDDLGLVFLTQASEELDRVVALPLLAGDLLVAVDDLMHALLDLDQILGRERDGAREIVIEAILDGRADGDLGLGIELLDRLGHHMGGVMAQQLKRVGILGRDDRELHIAVDDRLEIPHVVADADRERRLGQASADRGRHGSARHRPVKRADRSIGQGNGDHGELTFLKG